MLTTLWAYSACACTDASVIAFFGSLHCLVKAPGAVPSELSTYGRGSVGQCPTGPCQKPIRLQSGNVGSESAAGKVQSYALESFGVRARIVPVAGSLPIVSSVALIL
jgi:hypothetical protein